jgi:hypothetical protein
MTESAQARQVRAAVEDIDVLGPTSYAWLGVTFDLPADVCRLAPPDGRRAGLLQAITWRLYADFFTAGAPSAPRSGVAGAEDPAFARSLSAANAGRGATEPGWSFVARDGSKLVVERLGLRLWADPDEVVSVGQAPPTPGDVVSVRMANEAPRFSPGFYMALSDRGLDPDPPRHLDRYYLNVRADWAARTVETVTGRLNAADLPFRLKVIDDPRYFDRCDTAVLSLQRKDRTAALAHVREIHAELRQGIGTAVPTLTLPLAPGLAFAEDPGDGASFGAQRCGIIAAAVVEAHEAGVTGLADRLDRIREHMGRAGTSLEAPYLGPATAGDPRSIGDASVECEEAAPCR